MKIILLGRENRSLVWLQDMFKKRGIESSKVLLTVSFDFNSEQFCELVKNSQAIVLDRILTDDINVKNLPRLQSFFIFNNLNDARRMDLLVKQESICKIRFYFCPVNVDLLADDIISIVGANYFMHYEKFKINDLEIDSQNRTITKNTKKIFLKNKEFELLLYLAKNRGKVISRSLILEQVWDMNTKVMTNTVDVHISKIRKIINISFGVNGLIKTIPCCGYIIP